MGLQQVLLEQAVVIQCLAPLHLLVAVAVGLINLGRVAALVAVLVRVVPGVLVALEILQAQLLLREIMEVAASLPAFMVLVAVAVQTLRDQMELGPPEVREEQGHLQA